MTSRMVSPGTAEPASDGWTVLTEGPRIATGPVRGDASLAVHYPWTGELTGTVIPASVADVAGAIDAAVSCAERLTRHRRYEILMRTRDLISERADRWSTLITRESGLCRKDSRHEVDRACDVLLFAAHQALVDDGQVFSGDITAHGRARKVYTMRQPLLGVISAITPFNHPLNQVIHKVAPSVATNNRILVKPSEKTPLSALALADTFWEAGLPPAMLQVVPGDPADIGPMLIGDPRVDLVTFTGSTAVGRAISERAGYRRILLELGGIDPAIVLDDADLPEAAAKVAEGAFRNSGQRCTAIKRVLVQQAVAEEFTELLVAQASKLRCGDPLDPVTDVGTVIDEAAAIGIERVVDSAVAGGARLLLGGRRRGAQYPATVLAGVRPDMDVVTREVFGPVAPVIRFATDQQAVRIANESSHALSAAVFTRDLERALHFVDNLQAGSVNIGEVPGYRLESTPFGGIKESGLGHKEGVIEAMKAYTNLKTYSLPWGVAN